ncbi:hypothetical protein FHS85_003921 [Rhodoligotrophos appendicifer]
MAAVFSQEDLRPIHPVHATLLHLLPMFPDALTSAMACWTNKATGYFFAACLWENMEAGSGARSSADDLGQYGRADHPAPKAAAFAS